MLSKVEGYVQAFVEQKRRDKGTDLFDPNDLVHITAGVIRDNPNIPTVDPGRRAYTAFKDMWRYDPDFVKFEFPFRPTPNHDIEISDHLSQYVQDAITVMVYTRFGFRVSGL